MSDEWSVTVISCELPMIYFHQMVHNLSRMKIFCLARYFCIIDGFNVAQACLCFVYICVRIILKLYETSFPLIKHLNDDE